MVERNIYQKAIAQSLKSRTLEQQSDILEYSIDIIRDVDILSRILAFIRATEPPASPVYSTEAEL